MIFRPEHARLVRQGRKTMTRRPIKPNEDFCRYRPGKTYAVQPGRGKPATCRLHIEDVHQERLGDIPYPDARQEGFATTEEFKAAWIAIHEPAWLKGELQMLADAENDDGVTLDHDLWITRRSLDLFDRRHADRDVWVIRFHLDTAPVGRFLALQSDELYTSNPARALPDEPEAVDPDTQRWITENADTVSRQWGSIEQARRDQDRAMLSREEQIVRLRRAARLRSVDASREIWALEKMLPTASPEKFVAKVQKTERKVFKIAA